MTERSVLIVVHDYPPIHSAGTERVLKFSQYLPEFGYKPIILTTGRYGGRSDDGLRDVHRADDLVHRLFSPLRRGKAGARRPRTRCESQPSHRAAPWGVCATS